MFMRFFLGDEWLFDPARRAEAVSLRGFREAASVWIVMGGGGLRCTKKRAAKAARSFEYLDLVIPAQAGIHFDYVDRAHGPRPAPG